MIPRGAGEGRLSTLGCPSTPDAPMPPLRPQRAALVATFVVALAPCLAAQDEPRCQPGDLVVDHATLEMRVGPGGPPLAPGRTARVPSHAYVCVQNTNTAAFAFSPAEAALPSETVAELRSFVSAAQPVLVEVLERASAPETGSLFSISTLAAPLADSVQAGVAAVSEPSLSDEVDAYYAARAAVLQTAAALLAPELDSVTSALNKIEALTAAAPSGNAPGKSMAEIDRLSREAVEAMRRDPSSVDKVASSLRERLGCGHPRGVHTCLAYGGGPLYYLPHTGELLGEYASLRRALPAFTRKLSALSRNTGHLTALAEADAALRDLNQAIRRMSGQPIKHPGAVVPYPALRDRAVSALGSSDKVLAAAAALDVRVSALAGARSMWRSPRAVPITLEEGRTVTVTAARVKDPALARSSPLEPFTVSTPVQKRWTIRPSVGVSLVHAFDATYPTYEAVEADSATYAFATGQNNRRFGYSLDLALTYAPLDGRDESGLALWLPVVSIDPTEGVRSIGVGAGISYRFFRLNAGAVWNRHQRLSGAGLNEEVTADSPFSTVEVYGRARPYVSLSAIGWLTAPE